MSTKPRDDLYYFQWDVSDAKALQKMLEAGRITLAQIGELFLAVMDYVDQVEVEVSPELLLIYTTYQTRVDSKREARVKVGMSKAENGRKGGQVKAANAKKQNAAAFKPPTLRQFQDAVKHYLDSDEIEEADSYYVDVLFDQMKDAGWSIDGEPIQRRSDWESVILARFGATPQPFTHQQYYNVFKTVFSTLHAMRGDDGISQADDITYSFFDAYDESTGTWTIGGEEFKSMNAALAQFLKQYTENIPP